MRREEAATQRKRKLSEVVAEQLMEEIKSRGWPVGESLGTETELMKRFSVSRATIIEAARQVEGHGVATMRRGAGGGLIVQNSAARAASRVISTYLELSNVTIAEQYEAARLVETEAVRLACLHVSEEAALELRQTAAAVSEARDGVALHSAAMKLRIAIADASGNVPLGLFMRALARVLTAYVRPDLRAHNRDLHFEHSVAADMLGVVEAIVAGNVALADHAVRQDVDRRETRARILAANRPMLDRGPLRPDSASKLGEKVALTIRDDIAQRGWRVGERLANEAEMPERYGGSQWVVRQATRLLELHGIVYMRRGQGGGLFVGEPSPAYTVEAAGSFLHGVGLREAGVLEFRRRLFLSIAQFAAIRGAFEEEATLADLLALTQTAPPAEAHGTVLAQLGQVSRNRVLALFGAILNRFVSDHGEGELFSGPREMLTATVQAVKDGDGPLARRRMGAYLQS